MIGITAYGGDIPWFRLSREIGARANSGCTPQFASQARERTFGNWEKDSVTTAVAAARDRPGPLEDRSHVRCVLLATNSPSPAEWLHYEIHLQLNGRTGARQLADPSLRPIHNLGGRPSENVCSVSIIGRGGI